MPHWSGPRGVTHSASPCSRSDCLAAVYFVYSATVEERYLAERLPEAYPAYRRSTKMLLPFLF
jgi:hypothetical protein